MVASLTTGLRQSVIAGIVLAIAVSGHDRYHTQQQRAPWHILPILLSINSRVDHLLLQGVHSFAVVGRYAIENQKKRQDYWQLQNFHWKENSDESSPHDDKAFTTEMLTQSAPSSPSIFLPTSSKPTENLPLVTAKSRRMRQITTLRAGAIATAEATESANENSKSRPPRILQKWRNNGETLTTDTGSDQPPSSSSRTTEVSHQSNNAALTTSTTAASTSAAFSPSTRFVLMFLVSAISCFSTWVCVTYGRLSPVRASSLHGLLASILRFPSFLAAASLSGAFTGMSSYFNHNNKGVPYFSSPWNNIGLLSLLTGLVYAWEGSQPRLQGILAGKGGRLGTLSVVATFLFWLIQGDFQSFRKLLDWVVQEFGVTTIIGLLIGIATAARTQLHLIKLETMVSSLQQTIFGWKRKKVWTRIFPSHDDEPKNDLAMLATSRVQQINREVSRTRHWVASMIKLASVIVLVRYSFLERRRPVPALLESTLVTFVCSLFFCPRRPGDSNRVGIVLPMSLIGLLASVLDTSSRHVATPMCVGGLVGMTRLPNFHILARFEASIWVTLLLFRNTTALEGVGGRLGVFTVLAVVLSHLPWPWSSLDANLTSEIIPSPQSASLVSSSERKSKKPRL